MFASSWWPQSENGIASRWNSSESNYENLTRDPQNLSPSEKYDLMFHPGQSRDVPAVENWSWEDSQKPANKRGPKEKHPALKVAGPATAWEIINHGNYQSVMPDNWWGHCNGWSSYAIAEEGGAPARDVSVKLVNGKVTECQANETGCTFFHMADIEALMSELYFSDAATFSGRRCDTDPEKIKTDKFGRPSDVACRDTNPGTMHTAMMGLLNTGAQPLSGGGGAKKLAFVIDHNYDWEVWNYPVVKFEISSQKEISGGEAMKLVCDGHGGTDCDKYKFNDNATRFVAVQATYWMISDGVSDSELLNQAYQRNTAPDKVDLSYVLELNGAGTILGGEWIQDPVHTSKNSKKGHPDFLWMPVEHAGSGENDETDSEFNADDNPYLSYKAVRALLDCANDASTCKAGGGEQPSTGNICEGHCGEQVTVGAKSCYCDLECSTPSNKDCCQSSKAKQGAKRAYVDRVCGG